MNSSLYLFNHTLPCVSIAVIGDNNWKIPNQRDSVKSKASRFRTMIRDIKKGKDVNDEVIKPLPRRRPSSSSVLALAVAGKDRKLSSSVPDGYNARAKVEYFTESGEPLPVNAIAYGHIPMDQFKGNTVKRLDVGIPLAYTIKHIPLATTVPMLKVTFYSRNQCCAGSKSIIACFCCIVTTCLAML